MTLGPEESAAFWEKFPVDEKNSLLERTRQALAFTVFTAGSKRFADLISKYTDVYVYNFDYVSTNAKRSNLGAHHAAELPFVFGHIPESNTAVEKQVGLDIRTRWVNFIKNGDPNQGKQPPTTSDWPVYDPSDPKVLILGKTVIAKPLPNKDNLDLMADLLYSPLSEFEK
jgi:para-nitrobenzyl esterase